MYRPYSQTELNAILDKFKRKLNIGNTLIKHPDCGHSYYAKINGIKEKTAILTDYKDLGSCSVCWRSFGEDKPEIVQKYEEVVKKEILEYEDVVVIENYHRWIYRK